MLFNSYSFLCFFPFVLVIYFIIPKKARYIWLLIASYYFYMGWNARYALLMAFSTVVTWISGLLIEKSRSYTKKNIDKLVVAGSFLINLSILVFFKYFDFLLDNINLIISKLGFEIIQNRFDIILPVGISFYTFQALSYTMDVYRGDIKAEKNPLKYALFVSFFPQLVAGPIERSKNLLNQIKEMDTKSLFDFERIRRGGIVMLWGFFQKMVIADRIAILVDSIYDEYYLYGSTALVIATISFAIQIYCDFASYSNIAIGAAEVMGFSLMENFNTPYFARNIKDFWDRWHISLSTWFKDYLYIPLGGSRKGTVRKYTNKLIVFLVSGLWHGASWNFVVWGFIHGIYQVVADILQPIKKRITSILEVKTDSFSYKLGQTVVTFILIDLAWIFFRADSLKAAVEIIWRIFNRVDLWCLVDESIYTWGLDRKEIHVLFFALIILFAVDCVKRFGYKRVDQFLVEQCVWFRWGFAILLFFMCVVFGVYGQGYDANQFIYFQF